MENRDNLYQKKLEEYMELKEQLEIQQRGSRQLLNRGVIVFNAYIPYLRERMREKEEELKALRK